jgi:putative ABC transport system permease protein
MSPRPSRPPRWAERLLSALVPARHRDGHLGDLREAFQRRARRDPHSAARWYRSQVLRSIPGAVRLRFQARNDDSDNPTPSMEPILQDLKYGLRVLRRSPGFAIVSTITLALAIGVNTSIFSLVSVIVFADLPMQEPETVALIRSTNAELDIDQGSVSPGEYLDLLERSRSFESLGALTEARYVWTDGDRPVRVEGLSFSAGLSETWKLQPVLGRSFAEGEDRFGAPAVAMLTHGFWQSQFAGRPDVIGETIRLDGVEHTIVGVANPGLEFASFARAGVITPLILNRSNPPRERRYLLVSGRLAPGVTHAAAAEEARRIGEEITREYPVSNTGWGIWSAPVTESLISEDGNTILLFLQLTVGMVILIACANVANMLLARATARAREMAVRSALGAARGRLLRQLLTESLVISFAAAGLGLACAWGINEAMIWISAGTEDVFLMAKLDGRVLAFTLLVSLVAPLAFGLLPAMRASASGPDAALRDGRSGDGGRTGKRARAALVTAQVALALTLMIVATLLTRSVIALESRPLGFDPEGLLTVDVTLPESEYEDEELRRIFFVEARQSLAAAVGSDRVELTNVIPGADFGALRPFAIEGREPVEGRASPTGLVVTVSPGYFELIGLPLERGRALAESDDATVPAVALVSRALADRYWPDENPVGGRFRISGEEEWIEVVGVTADVRSSSSTEQVSLNVYRPHDQSSRANMYLVTRTRAEPEALAGPIRDAIQRIDADLPVDAIRTMERARYESQATSYALLTLFVTFAFFALLMSAIGIYGVMAYAVAQRGSEIGLRMALGAEVGSVRWMILRQGGTLLGAGMAIGLVASFVLSRLLGNVVYGVTTSDPATFVGVPIVLGTVALLANFIPARRATRLDPAKTLRAD